MKNLPFWKIIGLLIAGSVLLLLSIGSGLMATQWWDTIKTATPIATVTFFTTSVPPVTSVLSALPLSTVTVAPTIIPSSQSTVRPSPTPFSSPTIARSPTTIPWSKRQVIGYSVQGKPIELIRLGYGERWFVLLGALHGGTECNTSGVVEGIIEQFMTNPDELPTDVTLYAIPLINQDGCTANTRNNANNVDLNRNWDTPDWQSDAEAATGITINSGGVVSFSEPETQLLRDVLLMLQAETFTDPLVVVSYHSAVPQTGLVQPGYLQPGNPGYLSNQFALHYSDTTGYHYSIAWVGNYKITGEFIYWANLQGIAAFDVELPDREMADTIPVGWTETHIQTNFRGISAIINMSETDIK